jgi:hypoxanthine phosphoribosyltransferase
MNKTSYTDEQIDTLIHNIIRQIIKDRWVPDYIVGLTRGGLIPAIKISQYLDIPMETLKVSLRDGKECESNCWMAEDAFGYVNYDERHLYGNCRWDPNKRKKILIVDDINDSGATLEWIKNDWQSCCLPDEPSWGTVWNNNVRFAVLVDNDASSFEVNYSATTINKTENDVWIEFPWEVWWKR